MNFLEKQKNIFLLFIAAVLGGCSLIFPSFLFYVVNKNIIKVFPLIEDLFIYTQLLLFISGVMFCFIFHQINPIKLGIVSVILMPVIAIVEMNLIPNTHNIWPIEFVLTYPYLALSCIIGAALGKFLGSKIKKNLIKL
jgi:hypothetical protein